MTNCPICGAALKATVTSLAPYVVLSDEGDIESYHATDSDVEVYCDNGHDYEKILDYLEHEQHYEALLHSR